MTLALGSWWSDWAALPAQLVGLVLGAFVVRLLLYRLIDGVLTRTSDPRPRRLLWWRRAAATEDARVAPGSRRRQQRAKTLGSVLKSTTTIVLVTIVLLMVLDRLDYNIAPLLASAGIVGVALGFGAQSLVKDFLSGICLLVEDQYGVGDVVDLGEVIGTVEAVSLRVTRIRDATGVVWHVRNGEILRVGNRSQGWSALTVDVTVAYGEDVDRVQELMNATAREMASDPEWQAKIIQTPATLGIQEMTGYGLTIRIWGTCAPNQQWGTQRELLRRIKDAFDREGVQMPTPPLAGLARPTPA